MFPETFDISAQNRLLGWLDIDGSGDTRTASRRPVLDILRKIDELRGLTIIPHPFTEGIGLLDDARKMSTKIDWLESGLIKLMQIAEEKVKYIDRDETGTG